MSRLLEGYVKTASSVAVSTRFVVRHPAILFLDGVHAAAGNRFLVSIEGISRYTEYLKSFEDVAELFCRIQQFGLVFDDALISMDHRVYPWFYSSKGVNPSLSRGCVRFDLS
ncbi:hypothetical protein [Microbulbifer epialgicus]|uniref:Uncharacterized protein n=1 Tax=Microbulbifer epialgicus TaxID=393907 RepID=A0ABV4P4L0_9GAMM